MSRNLIRLCSTGGLMLILVALAAQPKGNTPFSRFGVGDIQDRNFASSWSMGGLGASFHHLYQPNLENPASLGYLQATALDVGFFANRTTIKRNDESNTLWSGNIESFSLSMPLVNPINDLLERRQSDFTWGLNLSLQPVSRIGYFIQGVDEVDSIGMVQRDFQGSGGLFRFNVGNGWKLRNLSFGVNIGYLFGQGSYETETRFSDRFNVYEHIERIDNSFSGLSWNTGAMYEIQLPESKRKLRQSLTLGMHYNSKTSFSTRGDYINFVRNPFFNDADTAVFRLQEPGKGKLPAELGFGVTFEETGKWKIGVNYRQTNWSGYENDLRPETLNDAWRISAGGAFTPDFSSISSYFKRVEYRAGINYEQDFRTLDGQDVTSYGVVVGLSMPFVFQRFFSYVNLGIEYGRRGTDTLKENYLRARIGFTLNDNQWFVKRRFN